MARKLALKSKATALTAGPNILDKRAILELLRRGLEHQRLGRFGDAAACYHQILAQRLDDPQANHFLGILERQRGNPDAAIRHLGRAVAADPQSPAYRIDLGLVRVGLGQFADAVEDFSAALRLNPAEPRALRGRGTALARILQNLGSPDWIAASEAEYVGIATALASNRESLANIRSGLRPRMESSSLCDPSSLAADLETAFRQMWRIWCQTAIEAT